MKEFSIGRYWAPDLGIGGRAPETQITSQVLEDKLGVGYEEKIQELIRKQIGENDKFTLRISKAPETHTYTNEKGKKETSGANYFADGYSEDGHRVLLSYLPPGVKASRHRHEKPIIERYILLSGELSLGDDGIVLSEDKPAVRTYDVLPCEEHQAHTGNNHAIVLIIMFNAAVIPHERQHVLTESKNGSYL